MSFQAASYVPDAVIRHCEFYGLMSQAPGGSIVESYEGGLTIQQTKFPGCTGNSGIAVPVVQNFLWKSITVEDTIFIDYGQRPELYGKTGYGAAYSWINVGPPAPPTADAPRREVVLRNLFLDEGGWLAVSVLPTQFQSQPVPVDLFYAADFYVNVSNFFTTGLYISGACQAMVEDSIFTWTQRANAALEIYGAQDAILDRVRTDKGATRLQADHLTPRLTVIDSIYTDLASSAVQTVVLTPATPDDDPVRYVRARFESALGREPDAAAHYYWSRKLLDCGADAASVASQRAALAAHLATNPAPTFAVTGRATDEDGQLLAGVAVTLTGTHLAATTTTDAQGNFNFVELPHGGSYTVTPSKKNYTFAPSSSTFTNLIGDKTADFAASLQTVMSFAATSYAVGEGGGGLTVTVTREGDYHDRGFGRLRGARRHGEARLRLRRLHRSAHLRTGRDLEDLHALHHRRRLRRGAGAVHVDADAVRRRGHGRRGRHVGDDQRQRRDDLCGQPAGRRRVLRPPALPRLLQPRAGRAGAQVLDGRDQALRHGRALPRGTTRQRLGRLLPLHRSSRRRATSSIASTAPRSGARRRGPASSCSTRASWVTAW